MQKTRSKGILLLETLMAVAILGLLVVSIFPTVTFMFKRLRRTKYDAQASLLMQEGIEVAYNVFTANTDWTSFTPDKYKVVRKVGIGSNLVWDLEVGTENVFQTRFTRTIKIFIVCRDTTPSHDLISPDPESTPENTCSTGEKDANSRVVTSKVSWEEPGAKPINAQLLVTKFN